MVPYLQISNDFKLMILNLSDFMILWFETFQMILNLSSLKKNSKTAVVLIAGVTISVPYSVHHCTIWCRSTFEPRGPGLSNPTSFLRSALPMAPTTDDNARDEQSVLRPKPATF